MSKTRKRKAPSSKNKQLSVYTHQFWVESTLRSHTGDRRVYIPVTSLHFAFVGFGGKTSAEITHALLFAHEIN